MTMMSSTAIDRALTHPAPIKPVGVLKVVQWVGKKLPAVAALGMISVAIGDT